MLCTNQKDDTVSDKESVIQKLTKRYSYEETIENGRIVLAKQHVKLLEIKDTTWDRENYSIIMKDYLNYIDETYFHIDAKKIDLDQCFNAEIVKDSDKKLPLFFGYVDNQIVGLTGCSKCFSVNEDGKTFVIQEMSNRYPFLKKKNGNIGLHGGKLFFMSYLFLLKHSKHIMFWTYNKHNAVTFHSIDSGWMYFNPAKEPALIAEKFTDRPFKAFFFFDKDLDKKKYKEYIELYIKSII